MPTNNKTANLNLNNWLATDKPKREDFVSDNEILDTIISSHLNDTTLHLSNDDRSKLSSLYEFGIIAGNGSASRTYTFSFEPKFVFVYLKNKPLFKYDTTNSCIVCNCGIAFSNGASSLGISLEGATVTLTQSSTATNGGSPNLNSYLGQYAYVAFK